MRLPPVVTEAFAPVHRQGWPFVALGFAAAILLGLLAGPLFWLGLLATLWVAYFFRDPVRMAPDGPDLVVSPADGVVQAVRPRRPPVELGLGDDEVPCVSVFMNVFDVHVNRSPAAGKVERRVYRPGKFVNAALDKASEDNERMGWVLRLPDERRLGLVQIAGLVARRIVPFVEEGRAVATGERIGLIRFGSRCDVYLPAGAVPRVWQGQRAVAGETILADGRSNLPPPAGVAR
jgi:phosphatidylserine decarboxylase